MERVVPDVPFCIKAKTDLAGLLGTEATENYTTKDWNRQTLRLSNVFFETTLAIQETNLWGVGSLEGAFKCKNPTFFLHTEEGEEKPMSSSFLSAFDLGEERAIRCYMEHDILNRGTATRSEEAVSLKLLPTAATVRTADFEKLRVIWLSVDAKELLPLKKEFPKQVIMKDLGELRTCLYPEIPEFTSRSTREEIVKSLCEHRAKYFNDFPRVREETEASVETLDLEDTFTAPEM